MSDTPAGLHQRHRDLLMSRSGLERLAMGCAMFDDARAIAEAGLRAQHPNLPERELRRLLIARFYGNDLSAAWLAKATDALTRY